MSIEVQQLLKIYGDQKAVNRISFTAGRGEIVGFLGPNGAGKSTTMKMITGYLKPTAGEARVAGISVTEDPLAVKKKIGYLPEQNALYYDMYVREYLRFIASVHRLPKPRQAAERALALTGLSPEAHKKIGQLSKGYKQRTGLAAALIHDPEVLILDEPTSGLDPNQILDIREVIRSQGENKTVLFSSHILQEVEAICNRIIIINKGEIVADDSLNNLQQASRDSHILRVEFGEPVAEEKLRKLPAVLRTEKESGNRFLLHSNDPENLRKQLMELSLREQLSIQSLQTEKQSLENIFRQLTGRE